MVDIRAVPGRRRVLIVDGDPSYRRGLAEDFASRACDVETAGTPDEAMARVAAAPPDLVVLDLYFPDGAALKLLRWWSVHFPDVVVILVSGNTSLSVVVDALKEGGRRFFVKPVSAEALLDELEERRDARHPYLSPLVVADHHLGAAALKAVGVDRFFAVSPDLLSVAGFDGYFKMLNPAWEKALGYSINELCSKPYLELVHPDDREKATDEATELRGGHTVFRFKNRYRCRNGSYRWLEWLATPSPVDRLVYASARDVTKSVLIENGLRESYGRLKREVASGERQLRAFTAKNETLTERGRRKDEAAAMIVHDLKNPLSVIIANYDFLLEGFEGSAGGREALHEAKIAGQRMLRLLTNLVDVSRLEDGTLDVHVSEVVLPQLVHSIVAQRHVLADSRKVTLAVISTADIIVNVDIDLVTRTLENLLDNALRYTPRDGNIEVELREAGANVEIRVANSGDAIAVDARGTIFDKYIHGPSDIGRLNLGLGLYFCRMAVEAQGGSIWVEESDRLPAVFGIRLPRNSTSQPRPAPATSIGVNGEHMREERP